MTTATPRAAWTALRANSSPRDASTMTGASTQNRTASVPLIGGPLGVVSAASDVVGSSSGASAQQRLRRGALVLVQRILAVPAAAAATPLHPGLLLGRRLADLAAVVRLVVGAVRHGVRRRQHARAQRRQQLLLLVDQPAAVAVRELVLVRHRQRAGRARLDAQPAEDAPQVVDLVDAAVPLAGRVPLVVGVVGPLDVDRVGGAGPGAQLAADALLQAVRVP